MAPVAIATKREYYCNKKGLLIPIASKREFTTSKRDFFNTYCNKKGVFNTYCK